MTQVREAGGRTVWRVTRRGREGRPRRGGIPAAGEARSARAMIVGRVVQRMWMMVAVATGASTTSGCTGYGRVILGGPADGRVPVAWADGAHAPGVQRVIAEDGRALLVGRDRAGGLVVRPETWPATVTSPLRPAEELQGVEGPATAPGESVVRYVRLSGTRHAYIEFPAAPVGVAFTEPPEQVLAEYDVPVGAPADSAARPSLYAELHLPARPAGADPVAAGPALEAPDRVEVRIIASGATALPDPFDHALLDETHVVTGARATLVYKRVIGTPAALFHWMRSLGATEAIFNTHAGVVRVEVAGTWSFTPH